VSLLREIPLPGSAYPEALRWDRGRLVFSEFISRHVLTTSPEGPPTAVGFVYGQPSGIGIQHDGSLVVVSMLDNRVVTVSSSGPARCVADLAGLSPGPSNELLLDERGCAYVGSFGYNAYSEPAESFSPASLLYVDFDGQVESVASDLHFPNGMALLGDGSRLVVAETFRNCLTVFARADDGRLSDRSIFADLGSRGPDGLAVSPSGEIWVACPFSEEIVVVTTGGVIRGTYRTPGRFPVDCEFGGERGELLFIGVTTSEGDEILRGESTGSIEVHENVESGVDLIDS
jgi:sugar lactone lactonase YvrE